MSSRNLSIYSTRVRPLLVLILAAFPAMATASEAPTASDTWKMLVGCVSERTDECRKRAESIAADESQPPATSRFAAILVEELQQSSDHPGLMRPRKIWIPLPEPEEARRHLPARFEPVLIVVQVQLAKDGSPLSVRLLKSTGFHCLDKKIEEAALRGYFRPALDDSGNLIESTIEFMYRIEPRGDPKNVG